VTEFPAIIIDMKTNAEVARFHQYVRPTIVPADQIANYVAKKYEPWGLASKFDTAKNFQETLADFESFLISNKLIDGSSKAKIGSWTFLTCGDWDLKTMLPMQCLLSQIDAPEYMKDWINIKELYGYYYNHKITGMMVRFIS
jgi:ERI1 exoribonuclease 3